MDDCDFEEELIAFLRTLEQKTKKTELIIVGDAFGLWEVTTIETEEKLEFIIKRHKKLFNQFKKTGEKILITLIPGNHDHELMCYPSNIKTLEEYNMHFEPKIAITRSVAGKKIWIEHGSQNDSYNYMPNFGSPHATPIGYYIAGKITRNAEKHSALGKREWLGDMESVYPNEDIFKWIYSNYFYKEMSPVLRFIMLPFMLLFSFTILYIIGFLIEEFITKTSYLNIDFSNHFGFFGSMIDLVFTINVVVIIFAILVSIPAFIVFRDLKRALNRYGLNNKENLIVHKEHSYVAAAKKVFKEDSDVAVYIYGHTHRASVSKIGNRAIINTGTWMKKLKRVRSRFRLFPSVYYPSFRLNYFRITSKNKNIVIDYTKVPKKISPNLTPLQHFAILGRVKSDNIHVSKKTVLKG